MGTCIVETGLLRKKVCARPVVTHCVNCEGALCAEHAIAEVGAGGKRSGKFVCRECQVALKEHEKSLAAVERKAPAKKDPAAAKASSSPPAAAPDQPAAAAQAKPGPSTLEFTPADRKSPGSEGHKS
jgi:hypothetical protein